MTIDKLIGSIFCADKKWKSNPLLNSRYLTINVYRTEKETALLEFTHNGARAELRNKGGTDSQLLGYASSSLQKKYRLHVISKNLK